jgi:hypothetical protein
VQGWGKVQPEGPILPPRPFVWPSENLIQRTVITINIKCILHPEFVNKVCPTRP